MRRKRNIRAELLFGARLQVVTDPAQHHPVLAPAIESNPVVIDDDEAATEELNSTLREVGMELGAMVGHQIRGGMTDRSTGHPLATVYGVLTDLMPIDGGVILAIDNSTDNGIIISFEHYTAGHVDHGHVRACFGAHELELNKISAAKAA